jgi:hypothetical protein
MPLIRPIGVSGSIPSVNQLALGDIAINTYDGKAYIKKAVGPIQTIVELGTGGGGSSVSASYALSSSYALNGGVTQLIAGTNVTLSPAGGTGVVTVNAILASSGSGSPNGPLYSLQYNNGGLFSGSSNLTLLGNNALYLTGSLRVSGSITGSLFGTASWATNALNANTASYVLNAVSSSFASTASFILLAQTASYVTLAESASYVLNAISSSFASTASFVVLARSASYVLNAVSASFSRTASYINPLTQLVLISGSVAITGSTGVFGDFSISNATLVDINTSVFNINAPTLQVPSFALAYSPSANIRTVMYDAISNALFVTSSLPGTGGGGGGFANYIATGSVTASVNVDPNSLFLVKSGSIDLLKITTDKVLVLVTQSILPSAVVGGIYVSSSGDFFFGQ